MVIQNSLELLNQLCEIEEDIQRIQHQLLEDYSAEDELLLILKTCYSKRSLFSNLK
jgi:hypothetical protein